MVYIRARLPVQGHSFGAGGEISISPMRNRWFTQTQEKINKKLKVKNNFLGHPVQCFIYILRWFVPICIWHIQNNLCKARNLAWLVLIVHWHKCTKHVKKKKLAWFVPMYIGSQCWYGCTRFPTWNTLSSVPPGDFFQS